MIDYLLIYLSCLIVVSNLIGILEYTNMKVYILSVFLKDEFFLKEELDEYLIDNWGKFGELLTCPMCYGTWLSLFVGFFACIYFDMDLIFPLFCMFSIPVIACLLIKKIR